MSSRPIGVGIIGTGFGSSVHLPAFTAAEDCRVLGITSRDTLRAQAAADKFGVKVYLDWQEMMADPAIHAVSIATPPVPHRQIIEAALKAGKSVLCEKPFCLTVDDAAAMFTLAQEKNVTHALNFLFRELPAFQLLQAKAKDPAYAPRHIEVRWVVGSWADPARLWSWHNDKEQGGGILGALVVHAMDYLEWMFGPLARVSAQLGTAIPSRLDRDGTVQPVTAFDHCHVLGVFQSGASLTCTVSNVAPGGTGHRIELHGAQKTIVVNSDTVQDYGKGFHVMERPIGSLEWQDISPTSPPDLSEADGRIALMKPVAARFIRAVRDGKTDYAPSFQQGYRTRLLIDLIEQAHSTGRWVDILSA